MAKAFIVKAGDTFSTPIEPKNGSKFELEELQEIVGGFIQLLYYDNGIVVCDEEGKLKDKPFNTMATFIAHGNRALAPQDFLVGDVLFCADDQID